MRGQQSQSMALPKLTEKSVIIHKDENGFGLRIRGQTPVYIEHVHEGGAAWRAGVRAFDSICKVNGVPVNRMGHKDVVLMFKSCSRFVALTLISPEHLSMSASSQQNLAEQVDLISNLISSHHRQYSIYSHHPREDRHLPRGTPPQPNSNDTTSLFASNEHALDTSPPLFRDRTQTHHQQQQQQQQQQCRNSIKEFGQKEMQVSAKGDDARSENIPQPVAASVSRPVTNKRIEIIREFIDTERTHTERLRCLDELFYRPMKQAGFMTGEQLRAVFACHRTLYKIHRQIYRILLSANFDIYSEPLVGSALLEIFEGDLKKRLERAACVFCSAQATNVELLNKLTRRDTKVGEFLAQVTSQRMIGRLGIKDLLASCFQRLTKYPLLLENLLKATPQISVNEGTSDQSEQIEHSRFLRSATSCRARVGLKASSADGGTQKSVSDDECSNDEAPEEEDDRQSDQDEDEAAVRWEAAEEARLNSRRMLAISLAEEREFVERALVQSRQILVRVNESIRVSMSRNKLKEIWKRTDKYPGVPLIDITKQQVVHEGLLTLRLSRRSFDVYVLLLNDYIIILTREGQDKYRLKFFTPEGKSAAAAAAAVGGASSGGAQTQATSSAAGQLASGGVVQLNLQPHQAVYSPVFVIDEHLTTRDAATDENGFYLLCKRKDDSRIYEFASRSPAERMKWRDKIQRTIEHQMSRNNRRSSNCATNLTNSGSETSANGLAASEAASASKSNYDLKHSINNNSASDKQAASVIAAGAQKKQLDEPPSPVQHSRSSSRTGCEPTKIVGTISYVIDDGIVMPNKLESSRVFVDQAIQVNILDGSKVSAARGQESESSSSTKLETIAR